MAAGDNLISELEAVTAAAREERAALAAQLDASVAEAHQVAQELREAIAAGKAEIRETAKEAARRQLARHLETAAQALRTQGR